jgi:hypothetical protein
LLVANYKTMGVAASLYVKTKWKVVQKTSKLNR